MDERWIVALISTDYDLQDEREAIISFLRQNNMDVSAFEEPGFPVQDKMHSHSNCIAALKRADLAILIIKERFGGRYYLDPEKSITKAEYESLSIPTIVLVHQKTWDERAIYKRQQKASGLDEEAYAKSGQYKTGKIDLDTIRFVDEIQKSYDKAGRSNWMNFWRNITDIETQLPELLASRSVTIIHQILDKQIKEVKQRKTSTSLSLPLGDVLNKKYYLDPKYEMGSGDIDESVELSIAISKKLLDEKDSCLILGEAGAGKTTLVAKSFLEVAEETKNDPYIIPVYIWLKGKKADSDYSINEYLNEGCSKYLNKTSFPFFRTNGFRFIFFFDGFDELAEKLTEEDLQHICTSEMFRYPLVLTSRIQFADRYISSSDFTSKFSSIIKLADWTPKMAIDYIDNFCALQKKGDAFKQQIHAILAKNAELQELLTSPLLVTIILYVIDNGKITTLEKIKTKTQVFIKCFELLAEREIENKCQSMGSAKKEMLILHWAHFAWVLYEEHLKGETCIQIKEVEDIINKLSKEAWPSAVDEVVFNIHGGFVSGAIHEQFLEYLVAHELVYACYEKKEPYPEFLKYVMRPEINRYFRGLVSSEDTHKQQTVFDNINTLYWECAGKTKEEDILKRVHAVYHLTRMRTPNDHEEIQRIFNSEKEFYVLQSLYFGVIKRGDTDREKEFYDLLISNQEYSNANRGYHLAYYDSIHGKVFPYTDNNTISWDGTLRAFHRHFSSQDVEHYMLRRIDLLTMRQFIEYRKKAAPLNDDEMAFLQEQLKMRIPGISDGFVELIEKEFENLKAVYEKYKSRGM